MANDRTQSAQVKKNTRAEEWLKNAVKDKHVRMIPFSEISKVKYNVAKGGSGTIHLGAWRNMHIAIKEQHNTNDLIKELKMHKQVHDSNYIVKFFGITKHPLTHDTCIVMQFAENGCLQDYLETQNVSITWLTKYRLAWEISSGLDFIHRENIFHTDLHSRNILIDTNGKALITDFGLSKSVNKTIYTTKAGLFGVVPYVAPERMQNPTYTYNAKCDIYSLGVIFWELSSCVIPFEAQLQDVMLAVNIIAGVREKTVPGTAVEYEMLYRRCWDGLPQNRPSMDIVLSELVELLAAEQINPRAAAARPISPRPPRPLSSESMVAPSTPFPYENEAAIQSSPENTTPMRPASPPTQRPGVRQSIAQGLTPVPSVPPVHQDRGGVRVSFLGDLPPRAGTPTEQGKNGGDAKANVPAKPAAPNGRVAPTPLPDSPTVSVVQNGANNKTATPSQNREKANDDGLPDNSNIPTALQLLPPLPPFKALALTTPPNDISVPAPVDPNNAVLPETASLALSSGISMVSVVSKLNLGSLKTISTISPPPPGAPPPPPQPASQINSPRVISPSSPASRPKVRNNQVPLPPGRVSKTISPPAGSQVRLVPPPGTPPPSTPSMKPSPSPSLNPTLKPPTGIPPSPLLNGASSPTAGATGATGASASATSAAKNSADPLRNPVSPIVYVPSTTYNPAPSKGKTIQDKKKDTESTSSSPSPEPRPAPRPAPMGFPVVAPLDPHVFPKRTPPAVEQSPSLLPSPPPSNSGTGPAPAHKTSRQIDVKNTGTQSPMHRANSPDQSRRDNDPRNSRPIEVNKVIVNGSPSLSAAGSNASPRSAQGFFPVGEIIRAGLSKAREPKVSEDNGQDYKTDLRDQRQGSSKEAMPPPSQVAIAAKPRFQFDNFYSLSDPYKDLNVDEPSDFFKAVTQGDIETIERLLKAHPTLIDEKIGFWPFPSAMLVAARSRHALETMKVLVKYGAALDRGDSNGITVLHSVCEQFPNPTEAIVFLTKAGADCNSRDSKKRTPLMALMQNTYITSTKVLVENMRVLFKFGAQTRVADHQHQRTPLHYAIQHCKEPASVIELLLKKGAEVNAIDSRKSTPLHMVLERMDNEEIVQMLLLYGADPSLKNSNKRNALCVAAEYLRVMSAWFLLENDLMSSAPDTIKKANELCSKADGPDKNSKPLFKNLLSDWHGKEGKVRRIQLAQDCVFRVQRTPDMKTIDQTQVAIEFLESAGVPLQDPDLVINNNNITNNNGMNNINNINISNNTINNTGISNNTNNGILNNNSNNNNNNNGVMGGCNGGGVGSGNNMNGGGAYAPVVVGGAGGAPGILRLNGLRNNSESSLKNNNNGNGNNGSNSNLNGGNTNGQQNGPSSHQNNNNNLLHHGNGHVQVKELRLAEGVEPLKQTMLPVKSVQQLEKEREAIRNQLMYANMSNAFGI
ncbi:hypothetical protein EDD11_001752 [Mortierella claussenii]|nr:hypothetical protein EDD11_001752 [Mortierella claussenii]